MKDLGESAITEHEKSYLDDHTMLCHKAYGKRIRLLRDARCWTQKQLAIAAGYSVKTIWKAETSHALKRQTLSDIAQALGVKTEDIARLPPPTGTNSLSGQRSSAKQQR